MPVNSYELKIIQGVSLENCQWLLLAGSEIIWPEYEYGFGFHFGDAIFTRPNHSFTRSKGKGDLHYKRHEIHFRMNL